MKLFDIQVLAIENHYAYAQMSVSKYDTFTCHNFEILKYKITFTRQINHIYAIL